MFTLFVPLIAPPSLALLLLKFMKDFPLHVMYELVEQYKAPPLSVPILLVKVIIEWPLNDSSNVYIGNVPPRTAMFPMNVTILQSSNDTLLVVSENIPSPYLALLLANKMLEFP